MPPRDSSGPVVHLAGMEDGFCPISHAREADALEEERRLLYVAVTRAERSLHLTWARQPHVRRARDGAGAVAVPARCGRCDRVSRRRQGSGPRATRPCGRSTLAARRQPAQRTSWTARPHRHSIDVGSATPRIAAHLARRGGAGRTRRRPRLSSPIELSRPSPLAGPRTRPSWARYRASGRSRSSNTARRSSTSSPTIPRTTIPPTPIPPTTAGPEELRCGSSWCRGSRRRMCFALTRSLRSLRSGELDRRRLRRRSPSLSIDQQSWIGRRRGAGQGEPARIAVASRAAPWFDSSGKGLCPRAPRQASRTTSTRTPNVWA